MCDVVTGGSDMMAVGLVKPLHDDNESPPL